MILFRCVECGHDVVPMPGKGRTREYAVGKYFLIPDDFLLPTCQNCGETYTDQGISEELDKFSPLWDLPIVRTHDDVQGMWRIGSDTIWVSSEKWILEGRHIPVALIHDMSDSIRAREEPDMKRVRVSKRVRPEVNLEEDD